MAFSTAVVHANEYISKHTYDGITTLPGITTNLVAQLREVASDERATTGQLLAASPDEQFTTSD